MKKFAGYIRTTIIAGIFFWIPVLIIIFLFSKIWHPLHHSIQQAAIALHIQHLIGRSILIVITTVILVLLCFLAGLLMKLAFVGKWKDWMERNVLRFVPGYLFLKQVISEQLHYNNEDSLFSKTVLLQFDDVWQPAILIEYIKGNKVCVVFVPDPPDMKSGSVFIAEISRVRLLPMSMHKFRRAIEHFGKGISAYEIEGLPLLEVS